MAGTGHSLIDGGAGTDTLVLQPTGELGVYLTHNPSDTTNPYDHVVIDRGNTAQTIYRNVENVNINGSPYDIGFLNLPGAQLQTLGVLSQLLFNQAPGVAFLQQWGAEAGNVSRLAAQVLASDAGVIQFVVDYLQTHSHADVLALALNNDGVVNHAYSGNGLALIASDHRPVDLMNERDLLSGTIKTSLVPLPVANHLDTRGLMLDGTAVVDRHINTLLVPIVTLARVENPATAHNNLADIPLITLGGERVLQVSLPVGVGLTTEQIVSDDGKVLALKEALIAAVTPKIDVLSVINDTVQQGIDAYVASVNDAAHVNVRTLVFNQDSPNLPNTPILVQGDVSNTAQQDALVIDAHTLPTDPLHVYLTHNSVDTVHPYATVVVNANTGDHTTFRNLENADLNGNVVDIKYLEQSGSQLEKIGVLSQLLLGHAPGVEILTGLEAVAGDTSALINQFLANNRVKDQLSPLNAHDIATLLVHNGLGNDDIGAIQYCEDYLQAGQSVADLVLVGINYQPVVDYAYGKEGLMLI